MPESSEHISLRVLLVDDDDVFWELVQAILEPFPNVAVHRLCDGGQVMPYLKDSSLVAEGAWPQLLILDQRMPRLDGTELLPLLKSDPTTRHLPVCLMSTSSQASMVNQAYDLGASMVMCKAMEFSSLRRQIRHLIEFWTTSVQPPSRSATGKLF